jgi:polysaccharide export outer membrane protein
MKVRIGTGLLFGLIALSMSGCLAFTPESGPTADAVTSGRSQTLPYVLMPLNARTIEVVGAMEPKGLAGVFTDRRKPADIKFGIGDVISITVFEAAAGGLFIPVEAGVRPGNFVALPDQAVDNDGNISVPYAGIIKAAGRTNVEVQNDIIQKIKNRAIEPQVIVALSSQRTNLISIMGDVNNPVRYAAAASGANDKITDAITRAGGIKSQGYETWVTLERGGKRATVPFENLIMDARNNIFVQPEDRIYVYTEPQKFLAFGASGQQGEIAFNAWRINLAEAVGKAGGLIDTQADPGTVFVYRREPREVAIRLTPEAAKIHGPTIPVIFQADLSDPSGYFVATKFMMRNQDVLFAANAKQVEVGKFLDFVNQSLATAGNAASVVNGAYAVRANVLAR